MLFINTKTKLIYCISSSIITSFISYIMFIVFLTTSICLLGKEGHVTIIIENNILYDNINKFNDCVNSLFFVLLIRKLYILIMMLIISLLILYIFYEYFYKEEEEEFILYDTEMCTFVY